MRYYFKSKVGLMQIIAQKGKWALYIGDECYGNYKSPIDAADDVYTFSTDCSEWDKHSTDINYQLNVPADIHEWKYLP